MEIRAFNRKDRQAVLKVLDSNIPGFLKPDMREDFTDYLDDLSGAGHQFFVLENHAKQILACGGVYFFPDTLLASFQWNMVARAYHRTGLGKIMLEHQLAWLREHHQSVKQVILESSQFSNSFFETFGFINEQMIENHYGLGLHRYDMRLSFASKNLAKKLETPSEGNR
jgi:N-acetylglutamate synthase-like GNAT family acetyltransferase